MSRADVEALFAPTKRNAAAGQAALHDHQTAVRRWLIAPAAEKAEWWHIEDAWRRVRDARMTDAAQQAATALMLAYGKLRT